MKKRSRLLLAGFVLAAALSFGALAADEPVRGGIYDLRPGENVTLTPEAAQSTETVNGTEYQDYYANAEKVTVSAKNLTGGKQYLLLVLTEQAAPTQDNIVYIDQAAAGDDGTLSLTAYPSALTAGQYFVYLVGGETAFDAQAPAASFRYDAKYTLGNVVTGGIDDAININDAMAVIYHIVGLRQLNATQQLAANVVTGGINDAININDAMQIIYYIVGKIDKF